MLARLYEDDLKLPVNASFYRSLNPKTLSRVILANSGADLFVDRRAGSRMIGFLPDFTTGIPFLREQIFDAREADDAETALGVLTGVSAELALPLYREKMKESPAWAATALNIAAVNAPLRDQLLQELPEMLKEEERLTLAERNDQFQPGRSLLLALLKDKSPRVREKASHSLLETNDESLVSVRELLLRDPVESVREAAALSVFRLAGEPRKRSGGNHGLAIFRGIRLTCCQAIIALRAKAKKLCCVAQGPEAKVKQAAVTAARTNQGIFPKNLRRKSLVWLRR